MKKFWFWWKLLSTSLTAVAVLSIATRRGGIKLSTISRELVERYSSVRSEFFEVINSLIDISIPELWQDIGTIITFTLVVISVAIFDVVKKNQVGEVCAVLSITIIMALLCEYIYRALNGEPGPLYWTIYAGQIIADYFSFNEPFIDGVVKYVATALVVLILCPLLYFLYFAVLLLLVGFLNPMIIDDLARQAQDSERSLLQEFLELPMSGAIEFGWSVFWSLVTFLVAFCTLLLLG